MVLSIYKLDSTSDEEPICVLTKGDHVIGRGPLLACDDKRVSRSQAVIRIDDDSATITSIHQNPCFYQSANSRTLIILQKDSPTNITDGDKFGLFPDQFWYRFRWDKELETNKENNPKNNVEDEAQEVNCNMFKVCEKISESKNECTITNKNEEVQEKEISVLNDDVEGKDARREELSDSDSGSIHIICNNESSHNTESKKRHIEDDVQEIECKIPKISDDTLDNQSKNEVNLHEQEVSGLENDVSANVRNQFMEKEELSDSDEEKQNRALVTGASSSTNDLNLNKPKQNGSPDLTLEEGASSSTNDVKLPRERCWYADECYRASATHKAEFSHPGDPDYDSDPNDNRPSCIYGANCYRHSENHRKRYKHPRSNKKPQPKQRRKRTKKDDSSKRVKKPKGESSEDDYDYDDPFLDDDSLDEYEEESDDSDSDWEENSEPDEETKELMDEAEDFIGKKK